MKKLMLIQLLLSFFVVGSLAVAQETSETISVPESASASDSNADSEISAPMPKAESGLLGGTRKWIAGGGLETRARKQMSSDVDYENQSFPSVFWAYREKWFETLGEAAWDKRDSISGNLDVAFQRQEYRQWMRGMLYPQKWWTPFAGFSLGFYQEKVRTIFYEQNMNSKTDWEPTVGAELGIQVRFLKVLFSSISFRGLQDMPEGFDTGSDEFNWSAQFQFGFSTL